MNNPFRRTHPAPVERPVRVVPLRPPVLAAPAKVSPWVQRNLAGEQTGTGTSLPNPE